MQLTWFKKHCLICAGTLPDQAYLCPLCSQRMQLLDPVWSLDCPEYIDAVHALWVYDDLSGHLIQRLKFHEDFSVLPFLGEHFYHLLQDKPMPEVIMPVPLYRWRLFKRGFNQAGELAKGLARKLAIPCDDRVLQKIKKTKTQASLHVSDRHKNIQGAFRYQSQQAYQHVALVDDVMTTGSTVNELARILKADGVKRVDVWVLARALKKR